MSQVEPADDGVMNEFTVTAMMYLAQHKGKALAKALKNGERDTRVISALMKNQAVHRRIPNVLALNVSSPEIVSCLIDAGASVRFNDDALIAYAANAGYDDTVEVLLLAGLEPTSQALSVAVINGHIDTVDKLAAAGAKLTDRIWKVVLKKACESETGGEILHILSPKANTAQIETAIKEFMAIDNVAEISTLLATADPIVAPDALEFICLSPKASSPRYIRLIRSLLRRGIKPPDSIEKIEATGNKNVVDILKRAKK